MRPGVVLSSLFHVLLVSLLMLSAPRHFDAVAPSVDVDLVRAEDIEQPRNEPKPEKPVVWDFPDNKPQIQLPDFSKHDTQQAAAPKPKAAAAAAAPSSSSPPPASSQSAPSNSQQAALTQQQQVLPSIAQQAPSALPKGEPSIFDPASIPKLLDLPNAQMNGFDSEAVTAANLSADERAGFKAHLRKCWKLAEGASPATRVVLRIYLRRDGALASEPVLIEASASRDGPAVLTAAKRALQQCQPFGFLPADKYSEWKVLDLSFTPRDMAGG